MPLTNRVAPTGDILALPFRGDMMGNRGVLHDADGRIVRPWNLRAWLICRTEFNGRHRTVMTPDRYTELFFLDEVHALAAGHRPCHECRRAACRTFLAKAGHRRTGTLDDALEAERLTGRRGQRRRSRKPLRHEAVAADLPEGSMVLVGRTVFALTDGGFIAWSDDDPGRYAPRLTGRPKRDAATLWATIQSEAPLTVLTPPTTRTALAAAYEPRWHASAADAERVSA